MSVSTGELATVVVDHRLRERRIAVRRAAGRRRLKRLLVLVLVAALSLATVIVLRSPLLDVDEIVVQGAATTDADAIRSATGITVGQPLLLADLGAARAAIEELPWVQEASVRRDLPGNVVVEVVEREPVAVVSGGGQAVLVDRTGRVLAEAPPPAYPPYVTVIADEVPAEVGLSIDDSLAVAIDLAGRLRANPAGVVAAVHAAPTLQLRLTDGSVVELGDDTDLDDKIEVFRTMYAKVDRTCLARIDLRLPTHPVLTRHRDCP